MRFQRLIKSLAPLLFISTFSVIFSFRIVNFYLMYQNRPRGSLISHDRILPNGKILEGLPHPKNYLIESTGKNTLILVGDSFGVGSKCGNSKNIAGCLRNISNKHVEYICLK